MNGLRVTDEETMEIAEMVLGRVNKSLVSMVQELGVKAVGISGKDGGLLKVDKKYSDGQDIGFVGDIKEVDAKILYDLLENDFLPIVAPIGMDDNFDTYNINADDAACAIAKAAISRALSRALSSSFIESASPSFSSSFFIWSKCVLALLR